MDFPENTGNEAVKSLQTLSFAVLVVVLSAYIFLLRNGPDLLEYESARHLSAWMGVNNLASALTAMGPVAVSSQLNWSITGSCADVNRKLTQGPKCFDRLCPDGGEQGTGEDCDPISITAIWPNLRIYDVELYRVLGPVLTEQYLPRIEVEGYTIVVKGNDRALPYSAYSLMRLIPTPASRSTDDEDDKLNSELWVITNGGVGPYRPSPREMRPLSWERTSQFLGAFGRKSADSLPAGQEAPVRSFFTHATSMMSGMEAFGLHLNTTLYISGLGFLLGAVTLAMYAPLLALRGCRAQSIQPLWI
jgi:hypothetical protein